MTGSSGDVVIAFDLYGTLLSTASIAKQLADHFGQEKAQSIAAEWRKYQLEYSWRLTCMGKYEPFSALTLKSLKHTLTEAGVSLEEKDIDSLMKAYDSLSTFPDVQPALSTLKKMHGVKPVVFTNGSYEMASNSVNKSPDLSPHSATFQELVVIEEVKKFKPAPEVYKYLAQRVGKTESQMGEMWLVSSNPFDVVGARACGMNVAWVDRAGMGWTDRLAEEGGGPTVIVKSLGEVIEAVKKHSGLSS
ncbi:haloacid dehalogenase, type II [Rhizodiscina lignyota]|uniref:Haloacid dehalogenase, type II n=1 Tax=Rhizodiscina lignyota TaxID=1504668 RepID=A0A9P4ICG8_9PEZI|nr:haloacid dehalogenase, type II [Rhizodiscina lignyota]